jgi:hypothetical protein
VEYFDDLRGDKLLFCRDPGGLYFTASEDRASEQLVTSSPPPAPNTAYKASSSLSGPSLVSAHGNSQMHANVPVWTSAWPSRCSPGWTCRWTKR